MGGIFASGLLVSLGQNRFAVLTNEHVVRVGHEQNAWGTAETIDGSFALGGLLGQRNIGIEDVALVAVNSSELNEAQSAAAVPLTTILSQDGTTEDIYETLLIVGYPNALDAEFSIIPTQDVQLEPKGPTAREAFEMFLEQGRVAGFENLFDELKAGNPEAVERFPFFVEMVASFENEEDMIRALEEVRDPRSEALVGTSSLRGTMSARNSVHVDHDEFSPSVNSLMNPHPQTQSYLLPPLCA